MLELVDGPTLADRIAQGPIPVDEALPIAKQIAEALEAAHEAGVIHRDLKPANIKLKPDGTVKVLDFGLAKALDTTPEGDPSLSPTLTAAATQMGVIMGTAAYMSPEQARGKPTDRRADIWSFGVVFFEMLTGQRAFAGEDVSVTLADVIRADLAWDTLPSDLPPGLATYLRRCLEKEPSQRIQAIGDVRLALEGAFETIPRSEEAETPVEPVVRWRERVTWGVSGALALGLVLAVVYLNRGPAETASASFSVLTEGDVDAVALAPNGAHLAYVVTTPRQLWVRSLDSIEARPLPGTEGARAPFWSPDSRAIGFFAGTELKTVDLSGGRPQTVTRVTTPFGHGAWGPDNLIVFGGLGLGALLQVPASGGEPSPATTLQESRQERAHRLPHWLPDGERFLYVVETATTQPEVYLASLEPGVSPSRVLRGADEAQYVRPGYLVFRRGESLMAQQFDVDRLALTGNAVAVVDEFLLEANLFSLSQDGGLAYVLGGGGMLTQLQWVSRSGVVHTEVGRPGNYSSPVLSPDDTQIAVVRDDDIWVLDPIRGTEQRITSHPANDSYPAWSPNGNSIVFSSLREAERPGIYEKAATGEGDARLVIDSEASPLPFDWSVHGDVLVYSESAVESSFDLWQLSMRGDSQPVPIVRGPFWESGGALSPDGRWLAYNSRESGTMQVYVAGLSESGGKWPISTSAGMYPRWKGDGRELYYWSLENQVVMAVDVEPSEDGLVVGNPRPLFQAAFRSTGTAATM